MNGNLYRIAMGDGDQKFFGTPKSIRRADAEWFSNNVPGFGEAMLFVVVDGNYKDKYVALTSKTLARVEEELAAYQHASVVVHLINNPTRSFGENDSDFTPIGMAVVRVV